MIKSPSIAPQPLQFPGLGLGAAPAPTLADVMTRLSQLQQNQAQILKAVQALQANQTILAFMIQQMFQATAPGVPNGYNQIPGIALEAVGLMIQNDKR
jgi:hypothetical protein